MKVRCNKATGKANQCKVYPCWHRTEHEHDIICNCECTSHEGAKCISKPGRGKRR